VNERGLDETISEGAAGSTFHIVAGINSVSGRRDDSPSRVEAAVNRRLTSFQPPLSRVDYSKLNWSKDATSRRLHWSGGSRIGAHDSVRQSRCNDGFTAALNDL
jgi:hypothetical protein